MNDDNWPTHTSESQSAVEQEILEILSTATAKKLVLLKNKHEKYLKNIVDSGLGSKYYSYDAIKPWLVFWILHSLELLNLELDDKETTKAINTLSELQHAEGGYSGGIGLLPHLATTYAAVHSLSICGTEAAYKSINRKTMYSFLLKMKQPDGSFRMHDQGEVDVRGSYCAISVATLLNILTPELVAGVAEFICKCQTYEGGLGAFPGIEAHGGYTYCGLSALALLNKIDILNFEAINEWVLQRQMQCEGGFQGRTNKLVDGCYSFWQGGAAVILELKSRTNLFNRTKLQEYVLVCCQGKNGGLKDKPDKSPDFYHTCYCLSGISLCQNNYYIDPETLQLCSTPVDFLGPSENLLVFFI
jgi:protein farnesyltransferase subunit beta